MKLLVVAAALALLSGCSAAHTVHCELRLEAPPPLGNYLPQFVFSLDVGQEVDPYEVAPDLSVLGLGG